MALRSKLALAAALMFPLGAGAQPGGSLPAGRISPLSGPAQGEPRAIALEHVRGSRAALGVAAADLEELAVESEAETRHTGTKHFYLGQKIRGIEVRGANLAVSIDRDGRVLSRRGRVLPNLRARAGDGRPGLTAEAALGHAARLLGLAPQGPPAMRERPGGPARAVRFADPAISRDEIPARLVYVERDDGVLRLGWNLVIRPPDGRHWWDLSVDAETGALLDRHDWMDDASYQVFPLPLHSPDFGPRSFETEAAADPLASPFGWHDNNGVAGAEFTDTRGNNVWAQEDVDMNDSGGFRPDGGAGLVFEFTLDLDLQPELYQPTAITNLFYWNNIAHDLFYQYGFDESSGNFQENNYGNGGSGGDPVQADAQDGDDINNAVFATPPDGIDPRMQMYRWVANSGTEVEVLAPGNIAGTYPAGAAQFGPALDGTGLTETVVQALDPADVAGPSTTDACSPLTNAAQVAGHLAIADRGDCNFTVKVTNAQAAGAVGVIIVNNQGDALVMMTGTDPLVIPSLFLGQTNGEAIEAELGSGVTATLRGIPLRDSDLDSGIILHEYAHGVSNRLTGGRNNVNCLDDAQSVGMGEGWSDFFALLFTAVQSDLPEDPRPIGAYVSAHAPTGPGIRTAPYSTDTGVNPLTFADIATASVHGVGEVWAIALWEVYWNLVTAYGFDADLYTGTGGNNLAAQLVIDGMKLQGCDPNFLVARDSVLLADQNANSGANECLIWQGFAKRGMGFGASSPGPTSLLVTEDFSVPAACAEFCGDGIAQAGEECDDGNLLPGDGCAASCEIESFVTLYGQATGGSVSLTVEGVIVTVSTIPGETPATVVANLAAAINADPTLQGLGVTASSSGDRLATTGSIDAILISDTGLNDVARVPALGAPGMGLLVALLSASALAVLCRRR